MLTKTEIVQPDLLRRELNLAKEPEDTIRVGAAARSIEELIEQAGFGKDRERIRPYREIWIESRWHLGGMLAKVLRSAGPGRGKKKERGVPSFLDELKRLRLEKPRAIESQRLSAFPYEELTKAMRASEELPSLSRMIDLAKPYWHQQKRKETHERIQRGAIKQRKPDSFGPFPLIYADPPWVFETRTPDKTHRMPDDHYPTSTDEEICDLEVHGKKVRDITTKDAALFLWCTSSNFQRALAIVEAWGFTYKTHLAWNKMKIGLGLIFRNQHEVLIYASKGSPPKPMKVFPSVFSKKATKHSVKPPEIRKMIERMYPKFGEKTRVELFCRDKNLKGWSTWGYEA